MALNPFNDAEFISTSELAARLCVSREYARRIIAKSGRGVKNGMCGWSISYTWVEKFSRIRKLCRATKKFDIEWALDNPGRFCPSFQCRLVYGDGEELLSLSTDQIVKLTEVFGPLPMSLGPEDASVLRTIEVFNNKRCGTGIVRRPWTDVWADRINRAGSIEVICENIEERNDKLLSSSVTRG